MNSFEFPPYVGEALALPLGHPSGKPGAVEQSLRRVHLLINHALVGLEPCDWQIEDSEQRYQSATVIEPYGFERSNTVFVIYGEERGRKRMIAIFKSPYAAADYFVWLVSTGKRKVDWQLFLELEP